jgi:hypothetical protein
MIRGKDVTTVCRVFNGSQNRRFGYGILCQAHVQQILEEYLQAVDSVTINEEHKLRREVETLRVEKSSWEAMRKELDDIKRLLYQ